MNIKCTFGHHWEGCTCSRCGEVRDQDHDWEENKCQRKCRRCGLTGIHHEWNWCTCKICGENRHGHHDQQGCECRVCHKPMHLWVGDVCMQCGLRCRHPAIGHTVEQPGFDSGYTSAMTAHQHRNGTIRVTHRCKECRVTLIACDYELQQLLAKNPGLQVNILQCPECKANLWDGKSPEQGGSGKKLAT